MDKGRPLTVLEGIILTVMVAAVSWFTSTVEELRVSNRSAAQVQQSNEREMDDLRTRIAAEEHRPCPGRE